VPRRKQRTLTEFELEIMQVLWQDEEVTVEEVRRAFEEAGKPLALPTIRTMLGILKKKGYVTRRRFGRGHAYRPTVSRDKARKRIIKDILERAFEGSALGLVATLVNTRMVSRKELEKIRELIWKYE